MFLSHLTDLEAKVKLKFPQVHMASRWQIHNSNPSLSIMKAHTISIYQDYVDLLSCQRVFSYLYHIFNVPVS